MLNSARSTRTLQWQPACWCPCSTRLARNRTPESSLDGLRLQGPFWTAAAGVKTKLFLLGTGNCMPVSFSNRSPLGAGCTEHRELGKFTNTEQ